MNRFHVTGLRGRFDSFDHVPEEDRGAVLYVDEQATGLDLLAKVLVAFGLDDEEHLAEIRVPAQIPSKTNYWPMCDSDKVYSLWDDEWGDQPDHRRTPLTSMVGVGGVFYLRFDFGDEWWWQCSFVGSSLDEPNEDTLSPCVFVQYPEADENGEYVIAERRKPLGSRT